VQNQVVVKYTAYADMKIGGCLLFQLNEKSLWVDEKTIEYEDNL